ncbi:hypothetical protein [Curtobacterium flaccumfaciens]|uniref:hypothetical protein n=1 Tax=Curtobacterium flaccumfaciens TaxID=2035 RepID=UPI001BDE887E|nr:hypothetical protein [Curtobacterium flaccumfaciens]MBT1633590.1 hypothetical protein [Curtobacterium flaccumfaciens pv. oortii]MCX2845298.1 hypothetical protein [Curtobacterium flaccumfaciens pv. oortii]
MTTDSTTNDNPTDDGSTNDEATAPVASPGAPDGSAYRPRRGGARFGTILWGVLLLVFAGAMAVSALPMFSVDTTTLLLAACIAAGVLLVVAGIVAALSRTRR